MNRCHIKLNWICFGFFTLFCLTGCSIKRQEDITNLSEFQHFIGKCLELKEDAFLFLYSENKVYILRTPGGSSSVPSSIAAYLENPHDWNQPLQKIVAIIPKGTKLYIYNVTHVSGLSTSITRFFATIDDPRFCNIPVDVLFLLKRNFVEREYDIKDRYLKYCDE